MAGPKGYVEGLGEPGRQPLINRRELMKKLAMIAIVLLSGCVNIPEQAPFVNLPECYIAEDGSTTNPPCLRPSLQRLAKPKGTALYDPSEYKVTYSPQHTYAAAAALCNGDYGCAIINRHSKTARIIYVYGDDNVKRHEEQHITYDDFHNDYLPPPRPIYP